MLDFLYTAVSWVLLRWHDFFSLVGLPDDGGANWALSIVFLTITARLLLFRFFVKQVKYQRHMQQVQPKMQALRQKYKNDKQTLQREMLKLQQEEGFNPLAGCLPLVLQIPIFIGLFHVLRHLANSARIPLNTTSPGDQRLLSLYSFTPHETYSAAHAKLFGAPLASRLLDPASKIEQLLGDRTSVVIMALTLAIISAAATYVTQRVVASSAVTPPEGTAATVQKLMRYGIPLSVIGSGFYFPIGLIIYWFTSNVWTMGQQFYINRYHPQEPVTKADAGQVGKTLAPRPGAKPAVDRRRSTGSAAPASAGSAEELVESDGGATAVGGTAGSNGSERVAAGGPGAPLARPSAPRPGTRPSRPAGSRPNGNRPSKAKKRR